MATKSFKLNDDDERKLGEIMAALNTRDFSNVMRKLINDQWVALQAGKTFVERRGGHPEHLLSGPSDLSGRQTRKAVIGSQLAAKARRRKGS